MEIPAKLKWWSGAILSRCLKTTAASSTHKLQTALAAGLGEQDTSVIFTLIEQMAELKPDVQLQP